MSRESSIPWNMKAKNGMRTFFTEETYNQWIGEDTHESRLNARLNSIGISLTSSLTPSSMFPSTPQPSVQTKTNNNSCQEAGSDATGQSVLKAGSDAKEDRSGLKSRSDDSKNELVAWTDVEASQSVQMIGSSAKQHDQFRKSVRRESKLKNTNMPLATVKAEVQNYIQKQEVESGEVNATQENADNTELNGLKPVKSQFTNSINAREEANVAALKVKKEKFDHMSTLELPEQTCVPVLEKSHVDDEKEIEDKASTAVQACHIAEMDDTVSLTSKLDNITGGIGSEKEEISIEGNEDVEVNADYIRPVSFYKEDTHEEIPVNVERETTGGNAISIDKDAPGESYMKTSISSNMRQSGRQFHRPGKGSDNTGNQVGNTVRGDQGGSRNIGTAGRDDQGGSRQANNEAVELEKAGNDIREHIALERMFYNVKDRNSEKYFADVFKKRPKNRYSKFTCSEQKLYLDLLRRYGNINGASQEIHEADFTKFAKMKAEVDREQQLFQDYLKSISYTCKKDYEFIHSEVEKYVSARYLAKRRESLMYPRFYSYVDKIILTDEIPDTPPTLQYMRPLLELGSVSKLVLPSIMPGMPQPCISTNFKKINDISPVIKAEYKGHYVWNKVVCSQDVNAEQLAVPNKCDVVMSSAVIKRLIDNQGKIFKYWDMPITVREYQIKEGDKTSTQKVVYIDKPVIRPSQFIPKDRIKLYQKHALRACSIRSNVRGHVFCGIKPVHELVKLPTVEEIEEELNDRESEMKETIKNDLGLDADSDYGSPEQKDLKKRKRKQGQTGGKGQVGVFDLEKDIDDLETFGMDSLLVSKVKNEGDKREDSEKLKSPEKAEETGKSIKRCKKSAEDDLEFLKNELKGIKRRAIKESFINPEMYKDKYSVDHNIDIEADCKSPEMYKDNCSVDHNKDIEAGFEHPGEKKNDTVSESQTDRQYMVDSKRKTKKDSLNVKNMSSLTEKMKQMSTIKSKLMQRLKGENNALDNCVASNACKIRSRSQSNAKSNADDSQIATQSVSNTSRLSGDGLSVEQNPMSDFESEAEGLVIDVPFDSPKDYSGNIKHSSAELDTSDMPKLEKVISTDVMTKSTAIEILGVENRKDENQPILSENDLDCPNLMIADEEMEESSGNTRGAKRRSTDYLSEEISIPKRVLRSAVNKEAIAETPRKVRSRTKRSVSGQNTQEADDTSTNSDTDMPEVPLLKGRGWKQELNTNSSSRSRSLSSENRASNEGIGTAETVILATRHSLDSIADIAAKVEPIIEPAPVKRGRGRPPKKLSSKTLKKEENEVTEKSNDQFKNVMNCNPKEQPEFMNLSLGDANIGGKSATDSKQKNEVSVDDEIKSKTKITDCVDVEMEEHSEDVTESKGNNDIDTVAPILRNRPNVRRIDSDSESDDDHSKDATDELFHMKHGHSVSKKKESKKDCADLEARKIKEMAEAMKLRIEDAKKKNRDEKQMNTKDSKVNKSNNEDGKGNTVHQTVNQSSDSSVEKIKTATVGDVNYGSNQTCVAEQHRGIESILSLQDKIHGPSTNKGSLAELFTARHGMSHCGFPVEDNVTYHQWHLGGINVLIRCKYHGFISGQGLVHISPKIEYQPNFGFEQDTVSETCNNWISIFIRPNSSLLKARINPFNSEMMMLDYVGYKDLVQPDSLFKPAQAFTDLHHILNKLKSLPVGQYLLKNNPRKDMFSIMATTEDVETSTFDLHLHSFNLNKGKPPSPVQWTPLDTRLMLPHQRKMNYIPCTYQPKDAKVGEKKKQPQKNKKKKKKFRDKD